MSQVLRAPGALSGDTHAVAAVPVVEALAAPTPEPPLVVDDLAAVGDAVNHDPATGGFRHMAWQRLAASGLWRLPVPRRHGGAGQGWEAFVDAFATVARAVDDVGLLLTAIAHAGAIRVLCHEGSEPQQARHLPTLVGGGLGSTAFTEAAGGSDVARIKATATPRPRSQDGWTLAGQKAHITNAPEADVVVVLGRLAELAPRDLTLFVLESGRPGLVLGPTERMLGCASSPTGDIVLDDVAIDAGDVLGAPGGGLAAAYRMFAFDRALYGLVAAARMRALVDWCLERTHTRRSFGVALAEHQLVQGRVADMHVAASVVDVLARDAVRSVLDGADDAALSASVAKLCATEQLVTVSISALQLHGHSGYEDGPVSRTLADGLGMLIAGGTSDIQRKHIFAQLQHLRGLR